MIYLAVIGVVMILVAILYTILLLTALSGLSLHVKSVQPVEIPVTEVTVIVPARNEATTIISCLKSLKEQDYPENLFDVIVSDDYSEDQTVTEVHRFFHRESVEHWQILTAGTGDKSGKKGAIERAIMQARGTLVLTTDADTMHRPGWISSMVRCYLETGSNMILGPVMFSYYPGIFAKLQTLEFLGVMGLTAGFANLGYPLMCNGANLGYEKDVFHAVGGFSGNERYASGDDQFLLWKVKQQYGGKSIRFVNDPEAITETRPAILFREFLRQRIRWISKSRGYHDRLVLMTGAVTYFFQVILLVSFLLGVVSSLYLYMGVALFCLKVLVDFPLVFSMARFFGKERLWPWFIPAQVFQVFYVTLSGLLAFLVPVTWKGRRI